MPEDIRNWSDEVLFSSAEGGDAIRSERERRIYLLQKDLVAAQLAAVKQQRRASYFLLLATVAAFLAALGSFASVAMTFIAAD